VNFEIVFINFCALSTAKGMTVNMKIEQFDDRELKEILLKIIEVIERE